MVQDVVYQAEVLLENQNVGGGQFYVGLAGGLFKLRLANHRQSFKNIRKRKDSKLSEFIWDLKDKGIQKYDIKWTVLAQESRFNRKSRRCQLCVREKLEILRKLKLNPGRTINKRDEIFRRCLHRYKHFLGYLLHDRNVVSEEKGDHNFVPQIQDIRGAQRN